MSIISREKDYSDLDLDFTAHPVTGDLVKKIGPDAIARSIRNLVFTNFYDRKFRSSIGSNAIKLLFENINPLTATILEQHIGLVISNFEPRAGIVTIKVIADPDNNGYFARIVFTVSNRPEPFQTAIFLERIR
jgi:phage baseplate assembly protein W